MAVPFVVTLAQPLYGSAGAAFVYFRLQVLVSMKVIKQCWCVCVLVGAIAPIHQSPITQRVALSVVVASCC